MSDQDEAKNANVDLFEGEPQGKPEKQSTQQDQQAAPANSQSNSYQELLEAITNDEGSQKYKSVSDALVGASHAQQYIKQLEERLAAAEQNGVVNDVTKEIKDALLEARQAPPAQQTRESQDQNIEDLDSKLEQLLAKRDSEAQKAQNRKAVNTAMSEKFGEKANEVLVAKAAELEVSPSFLKSMAETSPKAFLKYFDAQTTGTPNAPVTKVNAIPNSESSEISPPENLMHGAKTKDVVAYWRQLGERLSGET